MTSRACGFKRKAKNLRFRYIDVTKHWLHCQNCGASSYAYVLLTKRIPKTLKEDAGHDNEVLKFLDREEIDGCLVYFPDRNDYGYCFKADNSFGFCFIEIDKENKACRTVRGYCINCPKESMSHYEPLFTYLP